MVSQDLVHWSEPVIVSQLGPDDDLQEAHYGIAPWRVGEHHFGFLMILMQVDDRVHFELVHSRDGIAWKRCRPGRSLVPYGEPGACDSVMVESPTPPITVGDEHWIYYGCSSGHHDLWDAKVEAELGDLVPPGSRKEKWQSYLGLARLRLDGWASLDAWIREGWVETKPIFSRQPKLIINGRCQPGGYIVAEVMDNWNHPRPPRCSVALRQVEAPRAP